MAESRRRKEHVGQFVAAYRQYCWSVNSLTDLKLAPFHLLASEGRVHTDKNHTWHMDMLASVCRMDPELLLATNFKLVHVTDPLRRVHECVFGVLALESEPVDPRL